MFHANSILLESISHDKDLVFNKFTTLIEDILTQFKEFRFDTAFANAVKSDIPEHEKRILMETSIASMCKLLNAPMHLNSQEFEFYKPRILASLTIHEQLYLMAHVSDLYYLHADIEEPNPMFASLVYSTVRELIIKSAK